ASSRKCPHEPMTQTIRGQKWVRPGMTTYCRRVRLAGCGRKIRMTLKSKTVTHGLKSQFHAIVQQHPDGWPDRESELLSLKCIRKIVTRADQDRRIITCSTTNTDVHNRNRTLSSGN